MQRHSIARTVKTTARLLLLVLLLSGCDSLNLPTRTPQTPTVGQPTPTFAQSRPTPTSQPAGSVAEATATEPAQPTAASNFPSTSPTPTLMPESERSAVFENVWQTVEDHYLYTDFHGADWKALHDEYKPKALAAKSSSDFYQIVGDMVQRLKDDHSRYLSPWQAKEEDALAEGDAHYVGIGVLTYHQENSILIIEVFPGSPAEAAGLKRRDLITAVDGQPFQGSTSSASRIRGPEGTQARLTVRSPGGATRDVTVTRRAVTGKISPSSSRLQADPSIGYLIIPSLWADDMGDQVEVELKSLLAKTPPLKGLVIDLRGNEGGWRTVLQGILGQFVNTDGKGKDLGHFYSQTKTEPLVVKKGDLADRLQDVAVVVLVDKGTESYAEVLAATLQASGRAKVVGVRSAGNTETVYDFNFEDDSRLWVAEQGFRLPDGTNLEGRGVIPDVIIDQDWTAFSDRDDPDILKAIELIHQANSK